MILFSANISKRHRLHLQETFPKQTFIFCTNMDEAQKYLPKARILVTYGEDLNEGLIAEAKNLSWIMVMSAGIDQLPFEAIHAKDILVTNARGIHKIPMGEYVIAMLLQVYRQAKVLMENEADHIWDRSVKMKEISGRTMLIAGTGAIGQEVARLAKAFQMKTYGISRSGTNVKHFDANYSTEQMIDVLPKADFVISVLPSTKETKNLFSRQHFQKMKETAIFLNMGRGDVVREETVLQAIQDGEIAHAVLDVFKEEPLPEDHPFWKEENITVTPHFSGMSSMYVTRSLEIFIHNLKQYVAQKDEFINIIDVTRGY
ncbi:MAG TPA: D-2-hydroxyacid dehydrogenase [Bacillota bacterium]